MFVILNSLIVIILSIAAANPNYQNYEVIRIHQAKDPHANDWLKWYLYNSNDCGCEVWKAPPGGGVGPIDVMLAPHTANTFKKLLQDNSLYWEVLIPNVEKVCSQTAGAGSVNEIDSFMHALPKTHPEAELLGHNISLEGNHLHALKVSFDHKNTKRVILVRSNMYANSWLPIATVQFLIDKILSKGKQHRDEESEIIKKFDWLFIPNPNPDGYVHSYTKDRLWSRNTRIWGNHSECHGVNPELNMPHDWHRLGKTCNEFGSSSLTERESQAQYDFMTEFRGKMIAAVIIMPYGQEVYYPAFHANFQEENARTMRQYGQSMIKAMINVDKNLYQLHELPPGSTSTVSAMKMSFFVPYPFYLYTQDTGKKGYCTGEIEASKAHAETFAGILALAKCVANSPEYKERA